MFKIKIPASKNKESADDSGEKKPVRKLPKLKITKPQPPPSQPPASASSTTTKPKKLKAKQIKLKLKQPLPGIPQPAVKKAPRIRVKPTRVPGEGYDSEASDIEDDPLVEEAIILRLLPDAELDYVRHCVETGEFNQFHIKWKEKLRAIVYINYSMYAAKLVNLPNIVEAQKTIDKKNIFKTVDISQILLVVRKIQNEAEIESIEVENGEVLPDGLTPPLQKITESKYRRKLTNDYIEKIESKVDELLRLDEEAEDSQFELIDPESLNASNDTPTPGEYNTIGSNDDNDSSSILKSGSTTFDTQSNSTQVRLSSSAGKDHDDDLELELEQALDGDFSLEKGQSFEIEDSNGEKIGKIVTDQNGQARRVGVGEEEEEEEELEEELEIEEEEEEESEDDDDEEEDENSDNEQAASRKVEVDEDAQHNALLKDEINELLTTIEQNKSRLSKTHNPLLQSRFIDSINKLEKELENKKRQLKTSEDKTANNKKDEEEEDTGSGGENEDREGEGRGEEDEEEEEEEEEGDNEDDDDLDDLFG